MFVSRYLYLYVIARTWTSLLSFSTLPLSLLRTSVLPAYTIWLPIRIDILRIALCHNTTCDSAIRSHIPRCAEVCERGMQRPLFSVNAVVC